MLGIKLIHFSKSGPWRPIIELQQYEFSIELILWLTEMLDKLTPELQLFDQHFQTDVIFGTWHLYTLQPTTALKRIRMLK